MPDERDLCYFGRGLGGKHQDLDVLMVAQILIDSPTNPSLWSPPVPVADKPVQKSSVNFSSFSVRVISELVVLQAPLLSHRSTVGLGVKD
jgi:hypothetical protein